MAITLYGQVSIRNNNLLALLIINKGGGVEESIDAIYYCYLLFFEKNYY